VVNFEDTIVAIATPSGRGGLGIVRVSGNKAGRIATALTKNNLSDKSRIAHYRKIFSEDARVIDECIVIYFSRPNSYTGEDVLEIYAHGSRIVLEMIVDRILALGARRAAPGEFTERAFLNNKIDLVQAEAVADLIDSTSVHAARSAMRSLEGEFSHRVNTLKNELVRVRSYIECALDFPEEDTDFLADIDINEHLQECMAYLDQILARARQGAVLKEGITVTILGRPNVGKSTLLNRLAGKDVAIVTDVAGTTRDLVEQQILLDGIPLHIIDTAGLRKTAGKIEQEGIRRAQNAATGSDIILMVLESGREDGRDTLALLENTTPDQKIVFVNNKIDLTGQKPARQKSINHTEEIFLSAKTGEGIELLIICLKEMAGVQDLFEDVFMARQRHIDALVQTRQSIMQALERHKQYKATELLAEDLRQAQERLNEVTGEFVADDLLGTIFSRFCIGK
jgi:tRNA modification GTPase